MKDCNCIFCKIANGEIPSSTVYEDEDFRVILDLGPAAKGHALILPKEHFKDVTELDPKIAAKVLPLGAKLGRNPWAAQASTWYRITVKQQDRRYSISMYM
jgi:histidine triad (HIT) family protein